ncbi:hypothetical protein MHYP_G00007940 [Metynnis hypsauchen]
MIALITALCLLTTVKTDGSGLEVQTVRSGNNVIIKCEENITKDMKTHDLAWYKQSLGKVPEFVMRLLGPERTPRFTSNFNDGRFTVAEKVFDLIINGIKEEDAGTYFCGKVEDTEVLNYAALDFAKRPPSSRKQKQSMKAENQSMYSQVQYS